MAPGKHLTLAIQGQPLQGLEIETSFNTITTLHACGTFDVEAAAALFAFFPIPVFSSSSSSSSSEDSNPSSKAVN